MAMNFDEEPTQFSILPPPEEEGSLGPFAIYNAGATIDPVVASTRAEKYNFAMSENSPGKDQIEMALRAGSEDTLRFQAITNDMVRAQRIRDSIAEDIVTGKGGAPLNEFETSIIKGLTDREAHRARTSPDVILEKLYGAKVVDMANTVSVASAYERMIENGGVEQADEVSAKAAGIIGHKERAQYHLEQVKERWKEAGMVSTVTNYLEQVVPFFSWYNFQNAIPANGAQRSFLPGNNIEDQIRHYYSLPPEQAEAALQQAVTSLEGANPIDAINFLSAVMQYSNTDKFVNNLIGVLDIGTTVPLTPLLKATRATGTMLKDVVRVASKPAVRAEEILEAAGERQLMATEYFGKVVNEVAQKAKVEGVDATWNDMFGKLTLLSNPKAFLEGGELAKSAVFLDRVAKELTNSSARMMDGILVDPIAIDRLVPGTPAFDEAIQEAISRVSKTSDNALSHVMYAKPVEETTLTGSRYVDVMYGDKAGVPFATEKAAERWKKDFNFTEGVVEPEGNGFVVRQRTGATEIDGKVRSLITPTDAPTPRDTKNLFLSWLRSPNELLSKDVVNDRIVATYGLTKMAEMGRTMLSEIKSGMPKGAWKGFDDFITKQRDFVNADGTTGKFSDGLAGFEIDWKAQFGRLPTEAEATAYMRYKQINDMEYAALNLLNYKNKTALGIQQIRLPSTFGPAMPWAHKLSPTFEGRIIRENPFDSADPFSFVVWNPTFWDMRSATNWFPNSQKIKGGAKAMRERIEKEGLVPVQLTKEGEAQLRANPNITKFLPDGKINYIYVKNPKAEALSINQLPYRPGGHVKLKEGFFVSQPEITRMERATGAAVHYYHGDKNLTHFVRNSDAVDFTQRMEKARELYAGAKDKDYSALRVHLQDELGGAFSVQEFAALFKGPNAFKLDRPFTVRATGSSVNDTENLSVKYPNLRMGTDDVHSVAMQRMDPQYFKERGTILESFAWHGSDHAPVLKRVKAEMVDPLDTMEASFQSVIKGKYMDDLRVKVTERFINEFAGILDVPIEQLKANPFPHMLDPMYKKGASKEDIQAANNLRRTTLEFLGIRGPLEKEISYVKQKMVDSLYQTIGKDGLAKVEAGKELLDEYTWGATKNPVQFMRSLAFHEKMGLFNVKQLFLQAQNLATIIAIEGPQRGAKAMSAYMLHRGMMKNNNSEIIDALAAVSTKFGWKKEELIESFQVANKTGFFKVGGEVAYLDTGASPTINKSGLGLALDTAAMFFKEGERISRISAWNSAYLRWKDLNPGKALIKDVDIADVLSRADTLNGNMTRASNAMWQNGIFSIPTQFWGYQARMAELMIGKRLTVPEKARMVAGYSLMYGLPTGMAVGIPVGGALWPWHDQVRKYMVENGMNYDESVVTRIGQDGIAGVAAGVIFGEPTNFSEQYSPQGLSFVRDLFDPQKGLTNLMLGVSGTTLVANVKAFHPLGMALLKVAGADNGYDLTVQDFVDAGSNISSFSNAAKAAHAYFTQSYYSKKGQKLADKDVSAVQALIMGATGQVPKEIVDAYAMAASLKDRKAMQDELRGEIIKNLRLAYKADSVDEADKYLRRANIHFEAGQFLPREYQQIIEQSSRGWVEMTDSIALKYAQTSKERMDAYLKRRD
jgi:hypothetical protein